MTNAKAYNILYLLVSDHTFNASIYIRHYFFATLIKLVQLGDVAIVSYASLPDVDELTRCVYDSYLDGYGF